MGEKNLKRHANKTSTKRRPRGSGTIFYSRHHGCYVGRVPIGRSLTGSTRYVEVHAATETECARRMSAAQRPGPRTTVAEWCEQWIAKLTVRPSTRDDYRHTLDQFILPTLGPIRLTALTSHQVEEAVAVWMRRLGNNTARKNLGHLRACLASARRAKLIPDNPAKDARTPLPKRVRIDPFTPDELARIIAAPGAGVFALLASVGCRVGEALALDVGDFDRERCTVSITKTYSGRHGIRPPKSENGVRTVRVPGPAVPAVVAAIGRRKRGPLFISEIGTRRDRRTVWANWGRFLKRLGIEYRNQHQLRHSCASALVGAGVPIADVAGFLGDSVGTVVKTYLHSAGADVSGAMERVLAVKEKRRGA